MTQGEDKKMSTGTIIIYILIVLISFTIIALMLYKYYKALSINKYGNIPVESILNLGNYTGEISIPRS